MRIVIRTDGSPALGMGHVTRSVAVADELRDLGCNVAFGGASGMAAKYVVERGYSAAWPNSGEIDLVINDLPPNACSPNRWRARQIFMADLLTGPEMMPIRREVLRARDLRDRYCGGHYGVLVTAGWSDSWDLAGGMRESAQGEARLEPSSPDTMLPAARRCSLAVVTMGVTAWEMACMGVPQVIVAPTEQHFSDARGLAKSGSAVVVDNVAFAGRYVRGLLKDKAELRRMSVSARALVDGHGARRVAERILEVAGR
jgi:spore coat polysaccharide biosynthesis predicted glycosyltransferase SpsG